MTENVVRLIRTNNNGAIGKFSPKFLSISLITLIGTVFINLASAADIDHDAEFYVPQAQHGDKWGAEDESVRLRTLE